MIRHSLVASKGALEDGKTDETLPTLSVIRPDERESWELLASHLRHASERLATKLLQI